MNAEAMDWDDAYREEGGFDGPPPWNIGEPQPELAALIVSVAVVAVTTVLLGDTMPGSPGAVFTTAASTENDVASLAALESAPSETVTRQWYGPAASASGTVKNGTDRAGDVDTMVVNASSEAIQKV